MHKYAVTSSRTVRIRGFYRQGRQIFHVDFESDKRLRPEAFRRTMRLHDSDNFFSFHQGYLTPVRISRF